MITRLKHLEIKGFRSFHTVPPIALDADVILIYGKNGSGKTSLMSAIEFGITGQVHDLSHFSSDYPRCLKNVRWGNDVEVKLAVSTPNGDGEIVRTLGGGPLATTGTLQFSKVMSRHFADRCYLSQSRLTRLLELYQAPDGDNPEQLLVRFIRELLGLDLLENITAGLFDAGDVRRLDNACPNVAVLRREKTSLESALADGASQLQVLSTSALALTSDIKSKIQALGDPYAGENWDAPGIKKRNDALQARAVGAELKKLQEQQGKLNRIAGFLSQSNASADLSARLSQQELLSQNANRREQTERIFSEGLAFDAEKFPELSVAFRNIPSTASISQKVTVAKTICERILFQFQEETKLKSEADRESLLLSETIEGLKVRLKETDAVALPQSAEINRRHIELLRAAVDIGHGEDCPVCGRDFSEAGAGSLKDKIRAEIEKLGADVQKVELATKQKSELTEKLNDSVRKLGASNNRSKETADRLSKLSGSFQVAQSISAFVARNEQTLRDLEALNLDTTRITEQLKALEIRINQTQEVLQESTALADELVVPHTVRPKEIPELVKFLSDEVAKRLQTAEAQRTRLIELNEQISKGENAFRDLAKFQKTMDQNRRRLEEISKKKDSVDEHVRLAKRLAQAASSAKTKLLNQVFNESLNGLWKGLYRRLARLEDFVPQLAEPTLSRGKIQTHIAATMKGVAPFESFASVSSLGNLNTAALSLFLALNLVETPKHHVLLLDDPVQNMDDMHVIQFASLLRAIAFQAKRQLVLAVHERALFDYLALELGPAREGDSLSLITVLREEASDASRVEFEQRRWKSDQLRFGT